MEKLKGSYVSKLQSAQGARTLSSYPSFNLGKVTFENQVSTAKIRSAAKHRAPAPNVSLVSGGGHHNLSEVNDRPCLEW